MSPRDGIAGPVRATAPDIDEINRVFSEAFTERYHRDGMGAVRVPLLNPAVWRYAIDTAGDGALLWRDKSGIAGFNLVHASGTEGWMGPLAVRPNCQGRGLGRAIVAAGIELLRRRGCRVIGLETMPRTIDNIGFYSALGFRPGHLTISLVRDVKPATDPGAGAGPGPGDGAEVARCRELVAAVSCGADFGREIEVTRACSLGDLSLVSRGDRLAGFALWHSAPLAAGRAGDELRLLKVVAVDLGSFRELMQEVLARARRLGLRRVSIRCQTAYRRAFAALLELGFRVHWTDLRMALEGYEERQPAEGVVFSNWEI
jgi:GNAT superfamily N-acetyltransferase